jgi:hypothetical protein
METWIYGVMETETWKQGDIDIRHGNMDKWGYPWRHGYEDMEAWT